MKTKKYSAKQNVDWRKRMNNIVEFGYPNLDNYFQNLLEIQNKKYEVIKEKWKNHFKDFSLKLFPL